MTTDAVTVAVVGAGVVGSSAGRVLLAEGLDVVWFDSDRAAAIRAVERIGGADGGGDVATPDVAVLASPAPHAALAAELLARGVNVVSAGDDLDDIADLLSLDGVATDAGATLVVGAALSPGLSGLLARHLVDQLESADEIHVAMHGTGGWSCARQHHHALGTRSLAWQDDQWVERAGGSGRELCWFPDPIGAVDCYRAAMADPVLLHEVHPDAHRISARVSATRRDRLTARLPMLAPPRRHGDVGGIRVEVRGAASDGSRVTLVAGAGGRAGDIAGIVAGLTAVAIVRSRLTDGVQLLGAEAAVSEELLAGTREHGVALLEFTGVARSTTW